MLLEDVSFWDKARAVACNEEYGIRLNRTVSNANARSGICAAEGDRLTERSEGGKLLKLQPRCPRHTEVIDSPAWGCFGGDARGPRRGRSPRTGPRRHKLRRTAEGSARRAIRRPNLHGETKLHAAQASQIPPDCGR